MLLLVINLQICTISFYFSLLPSARVQVVQTAAQQRRHYGGETPTGNRFATRAACTTSCTTCPGRPPWKRKTSRPATESCPPSQKRSGTDRDLDSAAFSPPAWTVHATADSERRPATVACPRWPIWADIIPTCTAWRRSLWIRRHQCLEDRQRLYPLRREWIHRLTCHIRQRLDSFLRKIK